MRQWIEAVMFFAGLGWLAFVFWVFLLVLTGD